MLTGDESFYRQWSELLRWVAAHPPVVDLGTSLPFRKEMAILRPVCPLPYFCMDVSWSSSVDFLGDGQRLPVRSGAVGTVLCSHVLEHVPSPKHVIDEVRRILLPGGRAYFTFLDFWPYHAGDYGDYHRFKSGAIELYLQDWSEVRVLSGGGPVQVLVNYLAETSFSRRVGQRLANLLDRRLPTKNTTPVRYVAAMK